MIPAGIDIGTTRSKISIVNAIGKPEIVLNNRGEHSTSSTVYIPQSGDPLIGTDAIEQGYLHPEAFVANFKLDIASGDNLLRNGITLTAVEATALLIGHLKRLVEKATGKAVTECVATCPANYRDDDKQALLDAFEQNGITVLQLIPEPTAAAISYALDKQGHQRKILVFDCGGGTLDVNVVQTDGSEVVVLSTEGVRRLGGNDFNQSLEEHLLNELEAKFGERPSRDENPLFYHDLDQRVERAKISLATQAKVPVVINCNGNQLISEITQDEFHNMIDPLVQEALAVVDRAVTAAGVTTNEIDHLIMVGGTSRLPYLQDQVAQHTGLVPKTDIDPEKAIAYGAALACLTELARQGRHATINGQVIPAPDMFVREVTAHDVGCCVIDTTSAKRRLSHSVIIPQNTAIPCRKTDRFYLEHEDQTQARVEILQGNQNADRDDCLLIGELLLEDLPEEDKATSRIELDYTIDGNGMITATATDLVGGKQQTVSVDYKKGIKAREKPAAA